MSPWDYDRRPSGRHDPYRGEDTFRSEEDDSTGPYPITWERDQGEPPTARFDWSNLDVDWPPRRRQRPRVRWLVAGLVAVAAASVGAAVVLTGNSGGQPAAAKSPPLQTVAPVMPTPPMSSAPAGQGALTMAQASQVLANYTTANNTANAQRSDAVLATIETGSSYAVDAGLYQAQQAENAATYPAFGPQREQYYIPRETAYPRWFVVQVANADLDAPAKVTSAEYLLFTQSGPGAPWKNAVEPYVLSGAATPSVALGDGGLATPVTSATALAVPIGQIAQVTASSLDGTAMNGTAQLPNPGNLADLMDRAFWQGKLPASSVTDAHAPSGPVYGLRTTDGGALLFYADSAELTLTAPAGEAMHLTIPGFYSPSQSLTRAAIGYQEQFATYDPPSGGGAGGMTSGLRVVADYSGITSGT
jgi:hypothetical protein